VKKSLLVLPIVLIAMAMALTACGGGGSSSSSSSGGGEEEAIEAAIETSATSSDPSKCTEAQTELFNETETGKTGAAALKVCEEEAEEGSDPAESVNITTVEIVEGTGAAAEVEIEGGSLGGQTVAVALEKEEGDWKVDGFMGFTKYDPAALAVSLEEKLGEEEGISSELAACIVEGVEEMPEEEVEAMVFEKEKEGFEEVVAACNG
jgi:hypothetical protein